MLFVTASQATQCPQHYLDGTNPNAQVSRELCYSEFAVGYSDSKKSAIYIPATSQATVYVSDNGFLGTYHTVTVSELQQMTGFDVFPSLPADKK